MASAQIPGTLPNPESMPEEVLSLKSTLQAVFDMGETEVDKSAELSESIPDIEYHSMISNVYDYGPTAESYYVNGTHGLYSAFMVYEPAFSYSPPPEIGIWGYLVALLVTCEHGSCALLNCNPKIMGSASIQHIPYPMDKGDFFFWADSNEPLTGISEDGTLDTAMGLLGVQGCTTTGVRLRVYSFYKFVERLP